MDDGELKGDASPELSLLDGSELRVPAAVAPDLRRRESLSLAPARDVAWRTAHAEVPPPEKQWKFCCSSSSKECVIFSVQTCAAFLLLFISVAFIYKDSDKPNQQWYALLGSSIGYVLPAPTLQQAAV